MSIIRTNRDAPFIHGEEIAEWDIHSANTSLMRYYNLLPEDKISKIEAMPKSKRNETVGKLFLKNKEFGKKLEKAFTDIIKEFCEANSLSEDDIVSIKKDAVFVRNRTIKQSQFGESLEFVRKNMYTGVLILPRYEFYYSKDDIDVKGISDTVLHLHKQGMLEFIRLFFEEAHDFIGLNSFLKEYIDCYKKRVLAFDAYRQFDSESAFIISDIGCDLKVDSINESMIDRVNILFNYKEIILEALKLSAR